MGLVVWARAAVVTARRRKQEREAEEATEAEKEPRSARWVDRLSAGLNVIGCMDILENKLSYKFTGAGAASVVGVLMAPNRSRFGGTGAQAPVPPVGSLQWARFGGLLSHRVAAVKMQ